MNEWTMTHIDEPMLSFGFNQQTEHPKDGLFLYGPPASNQNPARMDVGVIGTAEGIRRYETWVKSLSSTIEAPESGREENKTMWPGFQARLWRPLASQAVRLRRDRRRPSEPTYPDGGPSRGHFQGCGRIQ
jgi:hypothetical protein